MSLTATARAHPNIAFIKYWGNADDALRLPVNPSISMNLAGLYAETTVTWQIAEADTFSLNDQVQTGEPLARVSRHLDVIRRFLGDLQARAHVVSHNNFPTGAGIASSAAAFAALTAAAAAAAGASLSERDLSRLARRGSGSAARSIPAGFVEWHAGTDDESFAESVAAPDHWDLVDVIAVVSRAHKAVGSTAGHPSAKTSDLQAARVAGAVDRLNVVRQAIQDRAFAPFAHVVEHDSNLMHAVMMTSQPPLFYWLPPTLTIMEQVRAWRAEGLNVCYTLDAGPNVHCICVRNDVAIVSERLRGLSEVVDVLTAGVGGAVQVSRSAV